jgi:hypothetical protein
MNTDKADIFDICLYDYQKKALHSSSWVRSATYSQKLNSAGLSEDDWMISPSISEILSEEDPELKGIELLCWHGEKAKQALEGCQLDLSQFKIVCIRTLLKNTLKIPLVESLVFPQLYELFIGDKLSDDYSSKRSSEKVLYLVKILDYIYSFQQSNIAIPPTKSSEPVSSPEPAKPFDVVVQNILPQLPTKDLVLLSGLSHLPNFVTEFLIRQKNENINNSLSKNLSLAQIEQYIDELDIESINTIIQSQEDLSAEYLGVIYKKFGNKDSRIIAGIVNHKNTSEILLSMIWGSSGESMLEAFYQRSSQHQLPSEISQEITMGKKGRYKLSAVSSDLSLLSNLIDLYPGDDYLLKSMLDNENLTESFIEKIIDSTQSILVFNELIRSYDLTGNQISYILSSVKKIYPNETSTISLAVTSKNISAEDLKLTFNERPDLFDAYLASPQLTEYIFIKLYESGNLSLLQLALGLKNIFSKTKC